jgi:hypothetical protein
MAEMPRAIRPAGADEGHRVWKRRGEKARAVGMVREEPDSASILRWHALLQEGLRSRESARQESSRPNLADLCP